MNRDGAPWTLGRDDVHDGPRRPLLSDHEGICDAAISSVRFHHSLYRIVLVHVMDMDLRLPAVARHGPHGVVNH